MKILTFVSFSLLIWSVHGLAAPAFTTIITRVSTTAVPQVLPTKPVSSATGSCKCGTFDAFSRIRGVDFNISYLAQVNNHTCNFPIVGSVYDQAIIGYYNVDFKDGAKAMKLRISNGSPRSDVPMIASVFLDHPRGTPFVQFAVQQTGGWCKFIEHTVMVRTIPKGVRHLWLVSSVKPKDPGYGLFNLDWLVFLRDVTNTAGVIIG